MGKRAAADGGEEAGMAAKDLSDPDACPHRRVRRAIAPNDDEAFRCDVCGKTIVIPAETINTRSQDEMRAIIAMTFGERWRDFFFFIRRHV